MFLNLGGVSATVSDFLDLQVTFLHLRGSSCICKWVPWSECDIMHLWRVHASVLHVTFLHLDWVSATVSDFLYLQVTFLHLRESSCICKCVPRSAYYVYWASSCICKWVPNLHVTFLHLGWVRASASEFLDLFLTFLDLGLVHASASELDLHDVPAYTASSYICKWVPRSAYYVPATGASSCICKWVFDLHVTFLHLGWVRASASEF